MKTDYKYLRLFEDIKQRIERKNLLPGDRLPSQRAMMKHYGVSYATVNKALDELAHLGLISREHGRGTFVADPGRRFLLPSKVRGTRLGILTASNITNPTGIWKGVLQAAQELGVKLEIVLYAGARQRRERALEMAEGKSGIRGALLINYCGNEEVIEIFRQRHYPYVVLDVPRPVPGLNCVLQDHRLGARTAVEHLLRHGRRRIALANGPTHGGEEHAWAKAKLDGYRDALRAAGIEPDPALVIETADLYAEGGREAAAALLERKDNFDGLFAANGGAVTVMVDALRRAGIDIPGDVAVVSFNVNEYEDCALPAYEISGIHVPRVDPGEAGVVLLLEIIAGRAGEKPPFVKELPLSFVRRLSCGCA